MSRKIEEVESGGFTETGSETTIIRSQPASVSTISEDLRR